MMSGVLVSRMPETPNFSDGRPVLADKEMIRPLLVPKITAGSWVLSPSQ